MGLCPNSPRWFAMACQISATGMHEEDYAVLSNIILFKSI